MKSVNEGGARTLTAVRVAQRRQFTEGLRSSDLSFAANGVFGSFIPGSIVGGSFKIVSEIGQGGMGVVYLVDHIDLKRQFALKVLSPNLVNEQNWLRFQAEAKTIASLSHPSFVKVYDLGIHAKVAPFYSMDYLDGRSLEEILSTEGPLQLEQALDVFLKVLDGLAYAHRSNIVHRDIKPGNIMLCTVGGVTSVKVLDFGISKFVGSDSSKIQSLTSAGDIFGSPYYMSPEQCIGATVGGRSDIYSVGCTLFEALTGYVPYEAGTAVETVVMHQEQEPPLISDVLPGVQYPPSLDLVLTKCLAKRPEDRYQSAKELAIDLTRIQEGKDLTAYSSKFSGERADKNSNIAYPRTVDENNLFTNASSVKRYRMTFPNLVLAVLIFTCIATGLLGVEILRKHSTKLQKPPLAVQLKRQPEPQSKSVQKQDKSKLDPEEDREPGASRISTKPFATVRDVKNGRMISFDFPTDVLIGQIYQYNWLTQKTSTAKAKGHLRYGPTDWLRFAPSRIIGKYPQYLKRFGPGVINGVAIVENSDSDEILEACTVIPDIDELSIVRTHNLTNKCVTSLNKFTSLRAFDGSHSTLGAIALSRAQCWDKIEEFHYSYCPNVTPMLLKLKSCKNLQLLDVQASDLTYQDYKAISELTGLRTLKFQSELMTLNELKLLANLPRLETIYLLDCGLDETAIPILRQFKALNSLRMGTPKTLARVREKFKAGLPGVLVE
ncbi:serine/threonine protein kinase [bacterium]|nr:serine/threonine protein kinase [bacterium]